MLQRAGAHAFAVAQDVDDALGAVHRGTGALVHLAHPIALAFDGVVALQVGRLGAAKGGGQRGIGTRLQDGDVDGHAARPVGLPDRMEGLVARDLHADARPLTGQHRFGIAALSLGRRRGLRHVSRQRHVGLQIGQRRQLSQHRTHARRGRQGIADEAGQAHVDLLLHRDGLVIRELRLLKALLCLHQFAGAALVGLGDDVQCIDEAGHAAHELVVDLSLQGVAAAIQRQ